MKNLIQHQEIHFPNYKILPLKHKDEFSINFRSKSIKCKNITININLNILQNLLGMHNTRM